MSNNYTQDTIESIERAYEVANEKLIESEWTLREANIISDALKDALGVIGMLKREATPSVAKAVHDVAKNANEHEHKNPNMRTLWEEVSEATLSWRGKHDHPLRLELVQIAGICINMIRQIDAGKDFKS